MEKKEGLTTWKIRRFSNTGYPKHHVIYHQMADGLHIADYGIDGWADLIQRHRKRVSGRFQKPKAICICHLEEKNNPTKC
jgi:hypothetical protein